MAPVEEKEVPRHIAAGSILAHPEPGEEVVISGIAGRFPDADDVYQLRDKMFDKVDLISDDGRRWKLDHPEIPQRTGKINFVTKFDASFFGVHFKQAHTMDPMCRISLEKAYEAIIDAGVNPRHLRGTRCGVFIGACFSESEKTWFYEKIQVHGFGITGCSRAMLANRISYWLGVNGPSYTVDSACSSSLYAMEHAYKAMRDGHCDAALVGGANLCLHPYVSLQFSRLGVLSMDGACKSFDNSANGYCRSEAIPMIFLQKAKDAKRIYATLVHAKTNCDGYKEQGITYPSGPMQYQLLKDFYDECDIDPRELNFIEAHGTGTKVGDPEECNAIDKIFCAGREDPLWIGSVKSNLGHSEPASGLCSVAKVVIAMESGFIPPNLHFQSPREGIPAFVEGRLKVVTEKEPWPCGYAGINSFGFGGANCHVLLKSHQKEKIDNGAPKDGLPRLVTVSGRTEEAVKVLLDDLESRPVDTEFIKLLHDIHSEEIPGHIYRGFTVMANERKIRDVQYYPGEKRKVWFIFSGMGSQWPAMGKSLMRFPIFAAAIEKCHQTLLSLGVDLIKIITDEEPKIFDNILNSFVGIAAIQIGLVDLLYCLGIQPDYIIGHSVGELGCAYADGCFTAEQMILAAYYRGLASIQTEFIRGSMAAVGMGYQKIKEILPTEIEVACHNGQDSCTLSGPSDAMKKFVSELTSQGVFAREVPCSNIAYHSKYITKAGPKLLSYLQKVIPHPKPRSAKWICTSLPQSQWKSNLARMSSAEYHTNNLLSPVLFEEASAEIHNSAITIEIAPHGLLQAILRRSLKKTTTNVALTQRGHADNCQVFLTGIGKLYEVGIHPQLANLYPEVKYPVSRSTPMISPLIRWEHSEDWYVTSYRMQERIRSGERTVSVAVNDEDMEYIVGHIIDGRNLFPATGYLALVWETIGMMKGELYTQLPIVFEEVRFNRATTIPKEGNVDFTIMVQKGSGNFEVIEGGVPIVSGRAYVPENPGKEQANLPELNPCEEGTLPMTPRDIYKELRLRGYHYTGLFRGLTHMDSTGQYARITWANNYVAFMDNMLQTQIMQEDTRNLYVPTSIQKLSIDAKKHLQHIHNTITEEEKTLPVYIYKDVKIIKSGGIEIKNLKASWIPRRKPLGEPVLEKYSFVPHIVPDKNESLGMLETIRMCLHLALENVQTIKVKVSEIADMTVTPDADPVAPYVASILGDLPLIQAEITVVSQPNNPKTKDLGPGIQVEEKKLTGDQSCLAVIASNLLDRPDVLKQAMEALKPEGFLIVREQHDVIVPTDKFNILVDRTVEEERIMLLKKVISFSVVPTVINITDEETFTWVPVLKEQIKDPTIQQILLISEKQPLSGLIGLVNCLRKEPGGDIVRCVFILDDEAPAFEPTLPFYAEQLSKGLAVNIYKHGLWGSYRHQALPPVESLSVQQIYYNNSIRGDLSSLTAFEGPLNVFVKEMKEGLNKVTDIYYSSINFRDVMLATAKLAADVVARGRINQDIVIGFEYSGRQRETGKRIMGMVMKGGMASMVERYNATELVWDVPDDWTLEDAATVPVVYGTAYSALVVKGGMNKGDTVLIHSGTGGVGLAAINLALFFGCTVFTTVGTQEKRDYIKEVFPQIKPEHIGNSRDTSFEQLIKRETNGRGVDLILNSLAEEKLQASVRCLAPGGRFLEIGKFDLANNNPLGMEMFLTETSFHGVMLDALFTASEERRMEFRQMMDKILEAGYMKPIKRTVFEHTEIEQAFRYMAGGKHMGKVLLKLRDEEPERIHRPELKLYSSKPRFFSSAKKSYIITGGLGGFGLELADWLALRGAKKIVLTSRNGLKTGYQASRIKIWKDYGAEVFISTQDIATEEGIKELLKEANELGPVAAIFNLAVVLRDAIFENQTEEEFAVSFAPKARATKILDKISREMCPELEQFVIFSSVSCGRGNAGQTNYGMANSVMERICEARVEAGYPGLAIQWGAIGDVGLVAEMQENHQELVIGGTLQQTINSCLECLDIFLKQSHPVVASMVVAEKRAGGSGDGNMVNTVLNIMGIKDLKTVSLHSSLAELGMDSMMAVEIKQTLEREFEVFLTAQDIRSMTFAKLTEMAAKAEEASQEGGEDGKNQQLAIEPAQGLGLLLRLIGDEAHASQPLVALDSKVGDAMANLQTKPNKPPVFFIPGIEGMSTVFINMAKNLNSPALCLQLPYNNPADSIQKFSNVMLPVMKPHLLPGIPYTIVGYSTGAIVALELALLLEAEGRTGKIFLIDGSPDHLLSLCKFLIPGDADPQLEDHVLVAIYNIFVPGTGSSLKQDLEKLSTWEEKMEHVKEAMPTTVPHSVTHQKIMATDMLRRLKSVVRYKHMSVAKIISKLTLIRPTEQAIPNLLSDDYNLSQFCAQPVDVQFVEGNHLTIVDNIKVSDIINSIGGTSEHEQFKSTIMSEAIVNNLEAEADKVKGK